jgi:hypothetical protein
LLLGLQLLPAPTFAAAIRGKGKRWTQGSTFVISDWQQPEAAAGDGWEPRWDARVREMAAANFTVLMGSMSSGRLPMPMLNKTTIQARRGQPMSFRLTQSKLWGPLSLQAILPVEGVYKKE